MSRKLPVTGILAAAIFAVALFARGCFGADDPIADLANRLRGEVGGLWVNGISPDIGLPATATVEQVAAEYFKIMSCDAGRVQRVTVLRSSNVVLFVHSTNTMCAALLDTDQGRKILLMEATGNPPRWWTKIFPVPAQTNDLPKIDIRADHFGYDRYHEYHFADGHVRVREIRVSSGDAISSCHVELSGEAQNELSKTIVRMFKEMSSSTNASSLVKDGTRYTVSLKSGNETKTIVNYEAPDAALAGLFRELNKVVPSGWQLHEGRIGKP